LNRCGQRAFLFHVVRRIVGHLGDYSDVKNKVVSSTRQLPFADLFHRPHWEILHRTNLHQGAARAARDLENGAGFYLSVMRFYQSV
jgi:hypothetical protein